jgi:hypothetical protein
MPMELEDGLRLLRRWWWLVAVPPLIVAAYGLANWRPPATAYTASMRFTAGQPADLAQAQGYDPNYYRWLTSEYIVTALRDWVQSGGFSSLVSAELAARGLQVPPGSLRGALAADNARSVLVVYLSWPDPAQVGPILEAVSAVLQDQNAAVFPQLGGLPAQVVPLEQPAAGPTPPSLRARLDLPLKVGLALVAGLGLALAAHYLDPFLRDRRELEQMGLFVVGEIPRNRK